MARRFVTLVVFLAAASAHAFCGFYVAKGDARIFNRASQVARSRRRPHRHDDGQRFSGNRATSRRHSRSDIDHARTDSIAEKALIDHLDAYSAPRLVNISTTTRTENTITTAHWRLAAMSQMNRTERAKVSASRSGRYTVGDTTSHSLREPEQRPSRRG
jgi:hypothetical protein